MRTVLRIMYTLKLKIGLGLDSHGRDILIRAL